MTPDKRKLYYIQKKSQSKIIVEVELTSLSFQKQQIEFQSGDITQFGATSDALYTLNKFGQLQFYRFQTKHVSDWSCKFQEGVTPKNFCISPDEQFFALTGAEPKKNNIYKNTVTVYSLQKLKPFCSTSFKFEGAINKMRMMKNKQKIPLLAAVTDVSFSFLLFEIRDKHMRLVCKKPGIHFGRLRLNNRVYL